MLVVVVADVVHLFLLLVLVDWEVAVQVPVVERELHQEHQELLLLGVELVGVPMMLLVVPVVLVS
jgi:hypothetical protein